MIDVLVSAISTIFRVSYVGDELLSINLPLSQYMIGAWRQTERSYMAGAQSLTKRSYMATMVCTIQISHISSQTNITSGESNSEDR